MFLHKEAFMRKLFFSGLVLALVGCSSTPSNPTKQDFVGDWSCSIKYEDIGVGTIDLIYLKSDGSLKDENFIFDHSLSRYAELPIKDYFSSPLKYLTISNGTWSFNNNYLIYKLKKQSAQRLIYPDTFEKIQQTKSFKNIEKSAFNIYSNNIGKEDTIELKVTKFSRDRFTVVQPLTKTYEGECIRKDKAENKFNGFLEALKEIFKIK